MTKQRKDLKNGTTVTTPRDRDLARMSAQATHDERVRYKRDPFNPTLPPLTRWSVKRFRKGKSANRVLPPPHGRVAGITQALGFESRPRKPKRHPFDLRYQQALHDFALWGMAKAAQADGRRIREQRGKPYSGPMPHSGAHEAARRVRQRLAAEAKRG